ncbi:hypothetical protein [Microbacterium sp. No. 7]|uniref:hypothetical protein n=1 Tax=Microbacterium sp. No. 7 TaxID=1714373 RepID=UPI0006ED28C8|nr:hypothetical protein [Microbacterium sp. No. 7]ALJ18689.1 hypothetical protein AOA12_01665 [Microbacterium sp. No. 7]
MRPAGIWREACRNIVSGTTRLVLFATLLGLAVGSLVVVDLLQIRTFTDAAQAYQRSGASIAVLEAPQHIDGAACQALADIEGVRAAGAVRAEERRLTLSALPGAPVPVSSVTAGFAELLGADVDPGAGVYLSDQVAEAIQAAPGGEIATHDGPVRVVGVYAYPSDGRMPGYGYMALVPVNDGGPFDACWADVWPQSDGIPSLLYTALSPIAAGADVQVSLGQLNATLGTRFSGAADFEGRLTRFAPLAAGLVALALGFLALRLRRLEIASNLHAGIARADQRGILAVETAAWIAVAVLLAESAIVVTIAADPAADRAALLLIAQRAVFAAVVGATAGALTAWLLTRERHLFRYFKGR